MTMEAELHDGTILEFPDGTDPAVMQKAVQAHLAQAAAPTESRSWGSVAKDAAGNFLPSAGTALGAMYDAVRHPIDTGASLYSLAKGGVKNIVGAAPDTDTALADAVGHMFKNRYGGIENIKNTLAEDPVGALMDASTLLSGGAGAVAKVPGLAKAAAIAGKAGAMIDPIGLATKGALKAGEAVGGTVLPIVLGTTTRTGTDAIKTAFNTGKEGVAGASGYVTPGLTPLEQGAQNADAFQSMLRRKGNMEDVIPVAQGALDNMRRNRQDAYLANMDSVKAANTPIDYSPILDATDKMMGTTVSPAGAQIPGLGSPSSLPNKLQDAVHWWGQLEPTPFHTPIELDGLKRQLGEMVGNIPFEDKVNRMRVGEIQDAIKGAITQQAPEYANAMGDYAKASDAIRDVQQAFSLKGDRTVKDTALRKLQSVMRDQVSSNYGNRGTIAGELAANGAPTLMPMLAGQALSAPMPRGLGAAMLGAEGLTALSHPATLPALIPMATLSSPRLMGEGAYYAGKGAGLASNAADLLANSVGKFVSPRAAELFDYQTGRLDQ